MSFIHDELLSESDGGLTHGCPSYDILCSRDEQFTELFIFTFSVCPVGVCVSSCSLLSCLIIIKLLDGRPTWCSAEDTCRLYCTLLDTVAVVMAMLQTKLNVCVCVLLGGL